MIFNQSMVEIRLSIILQNALQSILKKLLDISVEISFHAANLSCIDNIDFGYRIDIGTGLSFCYGICEVYGICVCVWAGGDPGIEVTSSGNP